MLNGHTTPKQACGNMLLRAIPQPPHQQHGASSMPSYLGLAEDDDENADTVLNRTKTVLRYHLRFLLMEVATYKRLPPQLDARNPPIPPTVPRRLHISNLPFSFTELDLRELARHFGNVVHCNITANERGSRGYGFVSFETEQQTQEAKKRLPMMHLSAAGGRPLVVNEASLKPYRWRMVWCKYVTSMKLLFGCDEKTGRTTKNPTQEELDIAINYSANVPQHHLRHQHMTNELQEHLSLAKQNNRQRDGGERINTGSSSSSGSSGEARCPANNSRGGGTTAAGGSSGFGSGREGSTPYQPQQSNSYYSAPTGGQQSHVQHVVHGGGSNGFMCAEQKYEGGGNVGSSHAVMHRPDCRQHGFQQHAHTPAANGMLHQYGQQRQPSDFPTPMDYRYNGSASPSTGSAFPAGSYGNGTNVYSMNKFGTAVMTNGDGSSSAAAFGPVMSAGAANGSSRTSPGGGNGFSAQYGSNFFSAGPTIGNGTSDQGSVAAAASTQQYEFDMNNFGMSQSEPTTAVSSSTWGDFDFNFTHESLRGFLSSPTFGSFMQEPLLSQLPEQTSAVASGNGINSGNTSSNNSSQTAHGMTGTRGGDEQIDIFRSGQTDVANGSGEGVQKETVGVAGNAAVGGSNTGAALMPPDE